MERMDHGEAVRQMTAEKYLLDELPDELRDAFEEHMFDCPECAFDIRAGVAFMDEAKLQLPGLTAVEVEVSPAVKPETRAEKRTEAVATLSWLAWLKPLFATPAFAGPIFAALLFMIGYQNLVTYPALRTAVSEPRLLPSVALHAGTRSGEAVEVKTSRGQGVVLQVEVPEQADFAAYTVDLYDPQGKLAWTHNLSATESSEDAGTLSLMIPGAGLQQGSYALAISGVSASGQRTEIERKVLAVQFNE